MSHIGWTLRSRRVALLAGCAFAAGALALSAGPVMAGCNSGDVGKSSTLTSPQCQADANASGATAIGFAAKAAVGDSTAVGDSAQANQFATAVGQESQATGQGSTAIGHAAWALGHYATSVGAAAGLTAPPVAAKGATSVGFWSQARDIFSVAIGGTSGGFDSGAKATTRPRRRREDRSQSAAAPSPMSPTLSR
jgi:hypothetical protein